ncbi:uncharacterized protein LOC144310722 isoform X2 [Canis aureus]
MPREASLQNKSLWTISAVGVLFIAMVLVTMTESCLIYQKAALSVVNNSRMFSVNNSRMKTRLHISSAGPEALYTICGKIFPGVAEQWEQSAAPAQACDHKAL